MPFFFSFLSFSVFLQIERERERERERGYIKLGIRRNGPKVTYLISQDSCGESFFFYGLFFYPEFLAFVPSATNPVQQLTFSFPFFADGKEFSLPFWGSQPIVWLLPSSFPCQATRVRSPSTNMCCSPCDPHSFLTVIL